jgi:hypothetical protein
MRKSVTRDIPGRKAGQTPKMPGTNRDTLAVLVRAAKGEACDGMVFDGMHHSFPVARVKDDRLATDAKQSMSGRAWEQAIATFQLRRAYDDGDDLAARNATVKLYELDPAHLSPKIRYDESGGIMAGAEFTKRMTQTRFVLWLSMERIAPRERLEPGLLCPDLETALYVRGALRDLRACPCCENPFLPDRPDQIYCSLRCRETHRKRRSRAKSRPKKGGQP